MGVRACVSVLALLASAAAQDPLPKAAGIAMDAVVSGEVGRPLSLQCLVYGFPTPAVLWFRGPTGPMVPFFSEQYEARGNVLLIRALDVAALGLYTCQAYNGIAKPAQWTVEVRAPRRDPAWPASPYLLRAAEPPSLAATTAQSIVEYPFVPDATDPVRTALRPAATALAAGAELSLPCEVGGYPEPDVYWTKDGARLQNSDRLQLTAARLTLHDLTVGDSGEYSCHAQNEFSSHSSSVVINVQQLHIPAQCTDNQFFADCRLIVRSKFCNHTYYSTFCCKSCLKAGLIKSQDVQLQADQSWMTPSSEAMSPEDVTQDPLPKAAGIAMDAVVSGEVGRPLSLQCLVYGFPTPAVLWFRGPTGPMVPFFSEQYEARGNVLLIRALDEAALGLYTCQAYNGIAKPAQWTVEVRAPRRDPAWPASPYLLRVAEPPSLAATTAQSIVEYPFVPDATDPVRTVLRPTTTTLAANAELSLPCEVDGYPEPVVHWTKDGVYLEPNDRMELTAARLTLRALTVADSGEYGCHARNEFTSHSSSVAITVQELNIPAHCTDNQFFANCQLIVRSKFCNHKYYSTFCCKSCVEAGLLNPQNLQLQSDQFWMKK